MTNNFQRVAIVNRGEAAMRFIHAAREFNHQHNTSLTTIALYTEPDRHALFVQEADEAVCLGPAQTVDAVTGQLKNSYVDYRVLERALLQARAEAVWVGWGFVAEHADFADLCQELGIVFIGPTGEVMRRLGDKISSKLLAEQAHIPVAPWSGGPVETLADAQRFAEHLGYPLLIKATAGGGGHGIRRVLSPEQLPQAFETARAEAFKAFGNPTVFMEQLIPGARHIEVQIIADTFDNTWAVGVRDCTIQRRHQKVLEEAPSPALTPEQDRALRQAAVDLSRATGYRNAGTVEFLYQPETKTFSFMEVNTRLQVEHPVTECTTGLDLVKLQIEVARGARLEGEHPAPTGHAIEVRLNAEDPDNAFAPAPGKVERFKMMTGPGIRIDTGVAEGDVVPPEFDSMIAKIIAHGRDRNEALARLRRMLSESVVVIKGGTSNKSFLLELLSRPEVQSANVDVGWLDRAAATQVTKPYADIALLQAAIQAYDDQSSIDLAQFYASALRGRPHARTEVGRTISLRYRGHFYSLKVFRLEIDQYAVQLGDTRASVHLDRLAEYEYWLTAFGRRWHIVSAIQGLSHRIEVDGVAHLVYRDDGGVVHAPAPAVVVSVAVKPGDKVSVGDRVAVLEAMKMEMEVVAPFSGRVQTVTAIPNVQVDTGAPLVKIEPESYCGTEISDEVVVFGGSRQLDEPEVHSRCRQNLEELRQLMLGFDIDPARAPHLLADWSLYCDLPGDCATIRSLEDEILNVFVDICSLFHASTAAEGSGAAPTIETYLFSYLRMLETQGEGLPTSFVDALRRALAHYGITSLRHTPQLEQSLLWIYKAHQRLAQQVSPVLGVLERRLRRAEASISHPEDDNFRKLLDRMISLTRAPFPAVSELASHVRYCCFDKPSFEHMRAQVYREVEGHLSGLAVNPRPAERRERMRALVECPQPLASIFCCKFPFVEPALRKMMLEVVTRRYYRARKLSNVRTLPMNGYSCVTAAYDGQDQRCHVFSTHARYDELGKVAQTMARSIGRVPSDESVVLDFYLWESDPPRDSETIQAELSLVLNQSGFAASVERVVVAVAGPKTNRATMPMQLFSYYRREGVFEEDKLFRGVHPMMAERLHFWRLKNFKVERLPSVEDVYLLHTVANDNPKDERLIGCAEIRDLTPVRNEAGKIIELPHLERMFSEVLAGMRMFQARRPRNARLFWNRIFLYVWPVIDFNPDEWRDIVKKLAPATDGLGLEQVVIRARIPNPQTGELRDMIVRISNPAGAGVLITFRPATKMIPIKPLTEYDQKVVRMRQRGLTYPYEILKMLTPDTEDTRSEFPPGDFVEHDFNAKGELVPVDRPYGQNKSNIILGVIRNFTDRYPEGMSRVIILGDPSKDLGALAEPECRRIIAALDLAEERGIPVEWFPISAGAKISMTSGVENMDWIARVLRRIVEFTQSGGEINLLIDGINVGAQPYWNAESTMLMHTRGILVMTPKAAMVLTGKKALDYSGSVSAEDNQGIGGYDRIMGPNGQAQYWARDIDGACRILFRHYEHTYIAPGERFPRRALTTDPLDRDARLFPHGELFNRVGDIFSDEANPGRKKSFDIRKVMMAVVDQDHRPLERWVGMRDAETAVVWDAHLGGYPVCLIGMESRLMPRLGFVPADGPDQWSAGTLFPMSSKKVARAINGASNNRPVVVLANLSGFDGSPESMRKLQLEYGAEIGRAVVNFKGPIVFCVISRYHGGAYVVFSRVLNEGLEVAALEGTFASVIGGAPAAAVVFAGEVEARAKKDERLQKLNQQIAQADAVEKGALRTQWEELFKLIHSEKLGEVAAEFDRIHSVQRALAVGALDRIIPHSNLRPYLVEAVERGIQREQQGANKELMLVA